MPANAGTKLHGKNGAIYLHNVKGGSTPTGVKVSTKTEWTLALNRDYVDATVFGDTNKTYLVGLKDITGTYAGILDTSGDLLVNATDAESVQIYLYAEDTSTNGTLIANGPGLFDASITANNTDAIRVSGNFRAAGNWTVFNGA
jgi:hypothetical protein